MSSECKYSIPVDVYGALLDVLRMWERRENKPIELHVSTDGFATKLHVAVPHRWRVTPLRLDQTECQGDDRQNYYETGIRKRYDLTDLYRVWDSFKLLEDTIEALQQNASMTEWDHVFVVNRSFIGIRCKEIESITRLANVEMIAD